MVRRLPGSKLPEGRRRSAEFAGELTKACADHAKAIDRAIARDNALAEAFSLPVTPAYVVGHAVYRGSLDKKGMKGRDCGGAAAEMILVRVEGWNNMPHWSVSDNWK